METLINCPLCHHDESQFYLKVEDHFLSKDEFQLLRCNHCSLVFTNPRPDTNEIGTYYKSDEYISHSNKTKSFSSLVYKLVRSYTLGRKYKLIQSLLPTTQNIQHLDYGCGTGHFIQYTSNKGWKSFGYEPDETARIQAHNNHKQLIFSNLKEITKQNYNVISLFHVLEHVHALEHTLKLLTGQLKENGLLVLALPNHNSFDAKHYGEFWAGYDVPRHLYHFNQKSIHYLAEQLGLKIEKIQPMIFDSYYVSMLSEKYLKKQFPFFKGLLQGFKSNRKASSANQEYSSLIYILRK